MPIRQVMALIHHPKDHSFGGPAWNRLPREVVIYPDLRRHAPLH
jgi:hypothetical protein